MDKYVLNKTGDLTKEWTFVFIFILKVAVEPKGGWGEGKKAHFVIQCSHEDPWLCLDLWIHWIHWIHGLVYKKKKYLYEKIYVRFRIYSGDKRHVKKTNIKLIFLFKKQILDAQHKGLPTWKRCRTLRSLMIDSCTWCILVFL